MDNSKSSTVELEAVLRKSPHLTIRFEVTCTPQPRKPTKPYAFHGDLVRLSGCSLGISTVDRSTFLNAAGPYDCQQNTRRSKVNLCKHPAV